MSTQNEEAPVSTTDLEALPNPGLLPDSLVELLGAAEDLEDTLDLAKFPDLSGTPSNPEQVERAVLAAAEWARVVREAYGVGERQQRYGGKGVLAFFGAGSRFQSPGDGLSLYLGGPPAEFVEKTCYQNQLFFFDYTFSRHQDLFQGSGNSLRDPTERSIVFTPDNWPEIRRRLLLGYGLIARKALGLTNWIREGIQGLQRALLPRIRKVGEGLHNRVRVQVEHAGGRREVWLTHMQADFLWALGATGTGTTLRRTKMELLQAIHELRPWIESRPRSADADEANGATYGVRPEMQAAISRPD